MKSKPLSNVLEVRGVVKGFGGREILRQISLDVQAGEFLTILGESGSGKTTLLRLIAGFEKLDKGEIWMDGKRLDLLPPYRREVNTVFQQYALFPHLSVADNVAYGLKVKGVAAAEISSRVAQVLALVRMESFAGRAPATLSGGQQQRIALARAIVNRPKLLLLDEPLSALDAHLRKQMQVELKSLQRELGISFVFVTHDQEEAMALSDRIALLRLGKLEQIATPREIYARPATAYTAQFIGDTNLQKASVSGGVAEWAGLRWPDNGEDGPALFSLRPEKIRLGSVDKVDKVDKMGTVRFTGRVKSHLYEGATELFGIEFAGGGELRARLAVPAPLSVGAEAEFEFDFTEITRVQGEL